MNVYLDWNATAPPLPGALEAMRVAEREAWGNPSSVHAHGRAARARVEDARAAVAELARADARDVLLTSGGTEANNIAVRAPFVGARVGAAEPPGGLGASPKVPVLVTSRLEHPSILRVAEALEHEGAARVVWVRAREDGTIDLEDLERAIAAGGVRLVCLQAVNPETGVIQPVADAAKLARAHGAKLHVDAVQAWGRVHFDASLADSVSVAAHKIRGPKGVGALVTKQGLSLAPVLLGGSQERGLRPGTVDGILCAGLAAAVRHAETGPARYADVAALRDELERALTSMPIAPKVNCSGPLAPHVTNLSFPGWRGPELVAALDLEGVSASSGSACAAGTPEPSSVLRAMLGEERAASAVRLSLGETTAPSDVKDAVDAFARILARSRT
jgi:cysteine desulfurase